MAPESINPKVQWSQKDTTICLVIHVIDPKEDTLKIDLIEKALTFEVHGKKALDSFEKYSFHLEFSQCINPKKYSIKFKDRRIKLVISKAEASQGEWGRLSPHKEMWLKFDIDSVELTDEETIAARKLADTKTRLEAQHGPLPEKTEIRQLSSMVNNEEISRDLEIAEKEMYDMIKNSYLTIYNGVVGVGYLYVFAISLIRLCFEGKDAITSNYKAMGWLLKSCQHTVYLEIIHSYIGITKTSLLVTFLQIFGRSVVLFGILDFEPTLQTELITYILVVSWTAIEVLRYPYYIAQTYEVFLPKLMWLRYNAWIPLYPIGIMCEVYLIYSSIYLVSDSQRFTLLLPNEWNFAFDYSVYLVIHLIATVAGGALLIKHMTKQRVSAMKKLSKLQAMQDVCDREKDLLKIKKNKAKSDKKDI